MNTSASEPTVTQTLKSTSFLPSLNFGNGLIEIAALTTLIGSSTAGDLTLGNRGAAGLVWGSISAFGSSSVIKTCASAASPGWLRQMLGLRTGPSDSTVGTDLDLSRGKKVARRMRGMLDNPLGVSCLADDPDRSPNDRAPISRSHQTYRDIYAFDSTTSLMLSELSSTPSSEPLTIHTHYHYAFYRPHHLRFQILVLSLSLLKSLEIYTLLLQGGILVGFLSGIPFLFSFISGVVLEVHDIISSRKPVSSDGHLDLVATSPLPTTKHLGGAKKVVLGALPNPRSSSPWWKLFWVTTLTLQTLSIVLSYFLLGQQKTAFVLTWAGFQLFWVLLRILIFNLSDGSHPMADRPMRPRRLEALPMEMRLRVANLVLGVGQYQAHVHPRSVDAYMDDLFDATEMARFLEPAHMNDVYILLPPTYDSQPRSSLPASFPLSSSSSFSSTSTASLRSVSTSGISGSTLKPSSSPSFSSSTTTLPANNNGTTSVHILAVIGDTALSSAAWMLGGESTSKFGPMDLYDSCVVVFQLGPTPTPTPTQSRTHPTPNLSTQNGNENGNRILAVPAARVFSARSPWFAVMNQSNSNAAQDAEDGLEPIFIPKGAGSRLETDEKTWIYWVPVEGGMWLQIKPGSSALGLSAPSAHGAQGKSKLKAKSKVASVLGAQTAEVLDDAQLTRLLGAGNLNIGLRHAAEVRDIVGVSRRGVEGLVRFLR